MESKTFQAKLIKLQSNMLNFAYILTSNRDDAYDLLQDTTLKVLDNKDKYVDNVNFKGWVFTIMRNLFINNYRKIVRSGTVLDLTDDLYHLNLPQNSGYESPEGSLASKEITAIINSFEDSYKVPFSMHVAGYNMLKSPNTQDFRSAQSRVAYSSPVKGSSALSRITADCRRPCRRSRSLRSCGAVWPSTLSHRVPASSRQCFLCRLVPRALWPPRQKPLRPL